MAALQQSTSNRICYVVYEERDDKKYVVHRPFVTGALEERPSTLTLLSEAIHAELPSANKPEKSGQLLLYEPGAMNDDGLLNPRRMLFDISGIGETSYNVFDADENKRPLIVIAPSSEVSSMDSFSCRHNLRIQRWSCVLTQF